MTQPFFRMERGQWPAEEGAIVSSREMRMRAVVEHFSLPDAVMTCVCDIAREIARADRVALVLLVGAEAVVFGQSVGSPSLSSRRFAAEWLNRSAVPLHSAQRGESVLPAALAGETRFLVGIMDDDGLMGHLVVLFDAPNVAVNAHQRLALDKLAQVASAHILQETLLIQSARQFFSMIERDKG